MYENHFSFKCKPFELVPNPDFLFPSNTHKKAVYYLDYGIKAKIGFILLSGEVGSGKTTIIRNLIKNLNGSVKLSRINYTKVTSEQLISMINKDFGLPVEGKNKVVLLDELNEFLIEQYANGTQPILLIDEAQNLPPEILEEIRLLSNLETDKTKLIQIILVGQPELERSLMLPELIQLRQRINIKYHLSALPLEEVALYIKHRLTIAGNPKAINLTEDMLEVIYRFSQGIPRLINILCDFALLSAFVNGNAEVGFHTMQAVARDMESYDYWNKSKDGTESGKVKTPEGGEQEEIVDDVLMRLSKLEETVNSHLSGTEILRDEIRRLEKGISRMHTGDESSRISNVFERLVEKLVCRILVKISDDNMLTNLSDRVASLKNMPSSCNGYIKHDNVDKVNNTDGKEK